VHKSVISSSPFQPPNAGKKNRKVKSEKDQKKEDIQKIVDLMKKIYEGDAHHSYTNEDIMLR